MSNLKNILNSFKIKNNLSQTIWDTTKGKYTLKPKIRENLLKIAYEFFDSLGVDVIISDITFTGSLANYNWSKFSDIDLHLIADFKQFNEQELPLYEELFMLKKTIFNDKHDITILGYEVELYVQDENEEHTSSGVYSVLNDEWIVEPKKETEKIDTNFIKKKSENWMREIDSVIDLAKGESLDDAKKIIKKFKEKIKKYRTCGLEKGGEYSMENLVFKVLRRNGYIEKLFNTGNKLVDDKLSIKEEEEIKDPKLSDTEKSKIINPDVEEFYKTLDDIKSNIYQQESGSYSFQKEVESVQIALDILGYPLPKYGVDGKFGPETARAVNSFKTDNKLKLTESVIKKVLTEGDIAGIDELAYNPVTKSNGIIGYGFNNEKKGPQNWKNHDTHLHIGFTNRDVAIAVIEKAKELGLRPTENWYKGATGLVKDVHTKNSFHYRVFDGEPIVSAGLDVGDGQGKKREQVTELIKWIYDTYEGKQMEKTPIVAFDNGRVRKKYVERPFLDKIRDFISGGKESEESSSAGAFISPEMADKLVEKLKEKDLKSKDLEKYTNIENKTYPVELITGDIQIKGRFNREQLKNIQIMIDKLDEIGIKNPYSQVGVLAVIGKETNFIPKNEICYDTTANSRIREKFGNRVDKYSESELDELKKDCEAFFDAVYGKEAGIGWNTKNTEKGDGYKYRGRGFNQITFKHNYEKIGNLIGMDLVSNPEKLNDVNVAAEAAVKFFTVNAKGKIPNFDNKEDAIKYFANINAGGGQSSSLDSALESGQRFDVVV